MSAWLSHLKTLRMQCLQAFRDAYTIIQYACSKNWVRNSSNNYFSGTVWQSLDSISNNILMVNLMVIFHLKIVYSLQINWMKSSCTIEWE